MQVTETLNEGLKRAYQITVTAAELDEKVTEKLAEAQPEFELKGFRKGKVPMALLRKRFGPKILGEALQESIDGAMNKHFEDSGDRPAMQPEVKMTNEDWKEGDDVEVDLVYEALPEIPEVELGKIKLDRLIVTPDDAAVDVALKNLAEGAPVYGDRKKGAKAKDGDQIEVDFVGKVNGVVFDGGEAEDYPLVLGSNSFIPGFEEQLVGAKAGDDVEVKVTFPAEYSSKTLAGKDAVFACSVKSVKAPKPADIDDALAAKFGADDLAALKVQITERLEAEYKGPARQVMKRALLDALDDMVKFELPPSLVDAESGQIAHQLWHEENPEVEGHDHDPIEPTDEHKKLGERRVRLGLLLAELGKKQKIEVSDAEMTSAVMAQARQYRGSEKQYFDFVQNNPQMRRQIQAPIFEDKVVDYVFEQADVIEKKVGKEALEKAIEALDED
ncbi:trigger factor [Rhodobacteraceae bacterium R_SAG10]|nr:trigger factor [Rhodobacteraceae bacterium R_SAG10]